MEVVAARIGESRVFPGRAALIVSTARRLPASSGQVLEGVIRHDGDPVIAEQLAWTGVDRFENGDPRRLARSSNVRRPIDVSVALALAVWRVCTGATRSVYEERSVRLDAHPGTR